MSPAEIRLLLTGRKFILGTEKDVQKQIEDLFLKAGIPYLREYSLNADNKIDFLIGNIGLEIKIKGAKSQVYRQLSRYCKFEIIHEIMLVTSISMGLPSLIHEKKTHIFNISRAWL